MLEILKLEELETAKSEIRAKQAEKQTEQEVKDAQVRAEAILRVEDAIYNTKLTTLKLRLQELGDFEVEERRAILEAISELEQEKAMLDLERKKEVLREEFENELLEKEEFDILMEELEVEHQARLTDIFQEGNEQRDALTQKQIQNTLAAAQMAVDVFSSIVKAQGDMAKDAIDKEKNERIEALNIALNSNEISQREYDDKMAQIEADADERQKALMIEQFEREKKLALVQVHRHICL